MSPSAESTGLFRARQGIVLLTRAVVRRPLLTLAIATVLAMVSVVYTASNLTFKTSRAALISPQSDYHQRWLRYADAFGESQDIVVVVEGRDTMALKAAIDALGARLEAEPDQFRNVLYRIDLRPLQQAGLQYLSPEELAELDGSVAGMGPLVRGDWSRFSVASIANNLARRLAFRAAEPGGSKAEVADDPMLEQARLFAASLAKFLTERGSYQSPWFDFIDANRFANVPREPVQYLLEADGTMGFLKLQPAVTTTDFSGTNPTIARLREVLAEIQPEYAEVTFTLTGIPVLESEEMADSQQSMTWASILSTLGVALLLFIGFRGFRYPMMGMMMLAVAASWSIGAATLLVGHLNILSVSFAAMLVGLGIDFAVIYLSRYFEFRRSIDDIPKALVESAASVGPGMITAATTTAFAFYVAIFTEFRGVAELGIITGSGILLCLASALIVLPALIVLRDRGPRRARLPSVIGDGPITRMTRRAPGALVVVFVFAGIVLGAFATQVEYDFNLLNMQAKGTPAVDVQNRMFERSGRSLLFAASLADSREEALELRQQFLALPTVDRVDEVASMLPPNDPRGLENLQSIHRRLAEFPPRIPELGPAQPEAVRFELGELARIVSGLSAPAAEETRRNAELALGALNAMPETAQAQMLQAYQSAIAQDLFLRLASLADASNPEPLTIERLPEALTSRFVSSEGIWLLAVYPKEQIWDEAPLEEFIREIRTVDPEVTGAPLQNYEASHSIRNSYLQAGLYALFGVCALVYFDFRRITHGLIALLPPFVGFVITLGTIVLLGVPLNPANLILLPLILGIGVDGGVHVVHDYRRQDPQQYRISPSTATAVVMTATTSMVGFGSLMIAAHRGLFSLGLVLSIGIGSCMLVSLLLVPSLLTLASRSSPDQSAPLPEPMTEQPLGQWQS